MFGSRHDQHSDATLLRTLKVIHELEPVTTADLGKRARELKIYTPRGGSTEQKERKKDQRWSTHICSEMLQIGLVTRAYHRVVYRYELRYSLSKRGLSYLNLVHVSPTSDNA